MIAVNGKPIGSFLTIDCYHIGRTPKSVCSGWGGGYGSNFKTHRGSQVIGEILRNLLATNKMRSHNHD
ncbi:hypothetical protein NIES39_J04270 [Arthrospira platensis NIES-39]|nr:hypothetical protein NIES39_J04210 [Arthrospira platensis NIES-39]BAI91474.1 hypothetical protein NIES39_J04270 [Arthrospira platensis NIES-39]